MKQGRFTVRLVFIAIIWTVGVYEYGHSRGFSTKNTPMQAVEQYVKANPTYFGNVTILPDTAVVSGGYYMVARKSDPQTYIVFFTGLQNGRWAVEGTPYFAPVTTAQNQNVTGMHHATDGIIVSTNPNSSIGAIVGYWKMDGTVKDLPFSLVEIGNLPLWGYKFPKDTFIEAGGFALYDKHGEVLSK